MLTEKIREDISLLEDKNQELMETIKFIENKVYNNETKAYINNVAEKLMAAWRDYRGHALKTSKKKDLVGNIVMVCQRTISSNNKTIESRKIDLQKAESENTKDQERAEWEKLAEKVYPYKDEYIRSSETVSEGVRQWDCLIDLIETGYVKEDQLIDYGIDLSQSPE